MNRVQGFHGLAAPSLRPRPGRSTPRTRREQICRCRIAELAALVALLLAAGLALRDSTPPIAW
jgi:hypothetical protein